MRSSLYFNLADILDWRDYSLEPPLEISDAAGEKRSLPPSYRLSVACR